MPQIYKYSSVADLQLFYGELLKEYWSWPVKEHLTLLSDKLFEGYQNANTAIISEINNHHPDWLGKDTEEIFAAGLGRSDMELSIAVEYGFKTWDAVKRIDLSYDKNFEQALTSLLEGEVLALQEILTSNPHLVTQKSSYRHGATLLHYAGNNGVEMWRQQVPLNLAEVVQVLLDAGADKSATMPVYGGQFTALELFESSAHPYDAGNREEVMRLLG